jgi:hypothetical protein
VLVVGAFADVAVTAESDLVEGRGVRRRRDKPHVVFEGDLVAAKVRLPVHQPSPVTIAAD